MRLFQVFFWLSAMALVTAACLLIVRGYIVVRKKIRPATEDFAAETELRLRRLHVYTILTFAVSVVFFVCAALTP